MQKLKPFRKGQDLRTIGPLLNQMVESINLLLDLSGDGLVQVSQTGAGMTASLNVRKLIPKIPRQFTEHEDDTTYTELASTQGTQDEDTWEYPDRDALGGEVPTEGVTVDVMTDLEYNTTTHKLQKRTRTLKFDRFGQLNAITAESELIDITTAVACP